jgi:hypothetical protein
MPSPKTQIQSCRFTETARELGADESDDALDRIMGELDLVKKPEPKPEKPEKPEDE